MLKAFTNPCLERAQKLSLLDSIGKLYGGGGGADGSQGSGKVEMSERLAEQFKVLYGSHTQEPFHIGNIVNEKDVFYKKNSV